MTNYTLNAAQGSYSVTGHAPVAFYHGKAPLVPTYGIYSMFKPPAHMVVVRTSGVAQESHSRNFVLHWWRGTWPGDNQG